MIIPCPDCQGTQPQCRRCCGAGWVPGVQKRWVEIGQAHKRRRLARMELTQRCAERLGLTVAELDEMERGAADPARIEAD